MKYFEKQNWDRYWKAHIQKEKFSDEIIGIFRNYFDNNYLRKLNKASGSLLSGRVLEVGAGTGYSTEKLTERGSTAYAIDYSDSLIETYWNKKNIICSVADGFRLPFKDNSFDVVWNAGVLEHFDNPEDMLSEMRRVCKPSGIICAFVPWIFDLTAHLKLYGDEKIFSKKMLNNLFKSINLQNIKTSVIWRNAGLVIGAWGRK